MLKNALLTLSLICGAAATNPAGVAFLKANKLKEGVVELPSGLQYKVLRAGDGTDHPTVSSACECHYEGRSASNYPDGPVFDSSYARGSPTTFAPNQVIKGWVSVQGPQRRPLPPPPAILSMSLIDCPPVARPRRCSSWSRETNGKCIYRATWHMATAAVLPKLVMIPYSVPAPGLS